jgi:hypothetical protein
MSSYNPCRSPVITGAPACGLLGDDLLRLYLGHRTRVSGFCQGPRAYARCSLSAMPQLAGSAKFWLALHKQRAGFSAGEASEPIRRPPRGTASALCLLVRDRLGRFLGRFGPDPREQLRRFHFPDCTDLRAGCQAAGSAQIGTLSAKGATASQRNRIPSWSTAFCRRLGGSCREVVRPLCERASCRRNQAESVVHAQHPVHGPRQTRRLCRGHYPQHQHRR